MMTLLQPGSRFYLGLDLGQARDYSAIAIAERRVELTGARDRVLADDPRLDYADAAELHLLLDRLAVP